MRSFLVLIFAVSGFSSIKEDFEELAFDQKIVLETKRIKFEDFPDSFNPSILKVADGIIMCFRYLPDRYSNPWLSFIGVVLLNDSFEPISNPQLISTRTKTSKTQSQSEDARLFSYRGRIFLIYNDNMEVNNTDYTDRRDMHIVELNVHQNVFTASAPLRLLHQEKIHHLVQKNWVPFEWDKKLLISYSVNPHEILYANLINGACYHCYETQASLEWELGTLRESTPAQVVDGEYLAFFHSGTPLTSFASWGWNLWHYFMGAYTFSASPPFEITRFTPLPIVAEGFYTQSNHEKRVIFPGGFIVMDPYIYVAYGKDDHEIWIAKLDKKELQLALKAVSR
jgi:predicted GH43/DUF377 family glycosyl hydrolase